jgi:hypothetical protein
MEGAWDLDESDGVHGTLVLGRDGRFEWRKALGGGDVTRRGTWECQGMGIVLDGELRLWLHEGRLFGDGLVASRSSGLQD